MTTSAQKSIDQLLAAFENGNLPQAIAFSTFTPPENIPAYKWTQHNRALAFLQGTGDARGFKQWKDAGRYVKKGAKSIYILGPILKKSNVKGEIVDPATGETQEIDNVNCVGYYGIPVFRMEDTEGEPLSYVSFDTKTLPLIDIAERWGIEVKTGSFTGEYYGYYSPVRQEIVLATDSERTFIHELSHAAHYRVDPKAKDLPKWQKEIIAELSAGALLYMMGKEGYTQKHFDYIKSYAENENLSPIKACMQLLDTCIKVVNTITDEIKTPEILKVA